MAGQSHQASDPFAAVCAPPYLIRDQFEVNATIFVSSALTMCDGSTGKLPSGSNQFKLPPGDGDMVSRRSQTPPVGRHDLSLAQSTASQDPHSEQRQTIPSYLHQISHSEDDDPFSRPRRHQITPSISVSRQQLIEACADYVFNSLPTHLLRIADMKILTRNEIWDSERSRIEGISDEELSDLRYEYSKSLGWHWVGFLEKNWCEECAKDMFKFAIFSHRWGEREPQFQGMSTETHPRPVPSGPGHEKLHNFCEKARRDFNCQYVWSDTCCINKESSSELEEAIRSMFRWYRLAHVCIVHLAQSLTVDDFDLEPWFTRGWTLQELLAPNKTRFYGKHWNPIYPDASDNGDTDNEVIMRAITRVTGIPEMYLQKFQPSCDLVADIMKWASKRKTTRMEDTAYSLLGLFNISIPIAYGEGHRAFYRLMIALANECVTPAFFAWAGRPSQFSDALPSSPSCYSRITTDLVNRGGTGHPSYEVTKLGVAVELLMFPAHRKLKLEGGFHVGTMWYFDDHVPLEPFTVSGGTAAVLPFNESIEEDNALDYRIGIVNFAYPDSPLADSPGESGEIVRGKQYFGFLLWRAKWGWRKLSTDFVIPLNCYGDVTKQAETVLVLHDAYY